MKLWLAALVAGVLLLGGGLGGFFIGYAADDHPDRPGAVWPDRGPHNFPDWPDRPPRDR